MSPPSASLTQSSISARSASKLRSAPSTTPSGRNQPRPASSEAWDAYQTRPPTGNFPKVSGCQQNSNNTALLPHLALACALRTAPCRRHVEHPHASNKVLTPPSSTWQHSHTCSAHPTAAQSFSPPPYPSRPISRAPRRRSVARSLLEPCRCRTAVSPGPQPTGAVGRAGDLSIWCSVPHTVSGAGSGVAAPWVRPGEARGSLGRETCRAVRHERLGRGSGRALAYVNMFIDRGRAQAASSVRSVQKGLRRVLISDSDDMRKRAAVCLQGWLTTAGIDECG